MDKKENQTIPGSKPQESSAGISGRVPEKMDLSYFREARLFLAKNRATLTFITENEVASIHFDSDRNEIFYKGHNVKNMTLTEEQWLSLQKFSDFLAKEEKAEDLKKAYSNYLDQLILRRIQRG